MVGYKAPGVSYKGKYYAERLKTEGCQAEGKRLRPRQRVLQIVVCSLRSTAGYRGSAMQVFKEFLKTTIVGGLFALLPILLFFLLFREILELLVGLATPIAGLFPKGTFDQAKFPVILALILLVGVSFLVGVAMRSSAGRRFWNRIERDIIGRLPVR